MTRKSTTTIGDQTITLPKPGGRGLDVNQGSVSRFVTRSEIYNRFFSNSAAGAVFSLSWGGNITFSPQTSWRITAIQSTAIAQPAAGPYVNVASRMTVATTDAPINKQLEGQVDALVPAFSPQSEFFTFGPGMPKKECRIDLPAGQLVTLQGNAYANLAAADIVAWYITIEYDIYNN